MAEKSSESGLKRPVFTAAYTHGVDDKRRLQIPSKWRGACQEMELTMILWPSGWQKDACLVVLPPHVMDTFMDRFASSSITNSDMDALRRFMGERSDTVTLDKSGRICLPDALAKAVGIDKEAVLVGMYDRFQIWNPERYKETKPVVEALAARVWNEF